MFIRLLLRAWGNVRGTKDLMQENSNATLQQQPTKLSDRGVSAIRTIFPYQNALLGKLE